MGIAAFIGFIFTVFLAVYTFANPDANACWVVRDLQSAATTSEGIIAKANAMGIDVVEGYPINMHKVYHAWFAWGFWMNFLVTAANATFWILNKYYYYAKTAFIGYAVSGGVYCFHLIVWILFGAIWRFSKAGTIASGDRIERVQGQSDDAWAETLETAKREQGY